jgi:hypothetical protein
VGSKIRSPAQSGPPRAATNVLAYVYVDKTVAPSLRNCACRNWARQKFGGPLEGQMDWDAIPDLRDVYMTGAGRADD